MNHMKQKISVIVPTFNGGEVVGRLLTAIASPLQHYTSELIVIDSGSRDDTLKVVESFRDRLPSIKILHISQSDFNHGATRNLGVRGAKGDYIFFFSQDVTPVSEHYFEYALNDLDTHPNAVAVFGKNIPYPSASVLQKIESDCRWDRIDRFVGKDRILRQSLEIPFMPYVSKNYLEWYFLGNTASCYRKSFLRKNPFPKIVYGEDMVMGKTIIEKRCEKIYDQRCAVYHSHNYTASQYYQRQRKSMMLRYEVLKLSEKGRLGCKLRKIFNMNLSAAAKLYYLGALSCLYFIKIIIMMQIAFEKGLRVFQPVK